MGTENTNEELNEQVVKNNLPLDMEKLAALRARRSEVVPAKKERVLRFFVVGTGQAGARLAESFFSLGYDAIAINTAIQDLKYINIPESNKLLLKYGLGGTSKDLDLGESAAEQYRNEISELIAEKSANTDVNILTTSLGGGSGAGSVNTLVDILSATNKPLIVIAALPMNSEDAQIKINALTTLSRLSQFIQSKKIQNLIVVDNAKIESLYHNVSQLDFYPIANRAIVTPIDVFNTYSMMPSAVKPFDPTEWSKVLLDGDGLSIYGEMDVTNYKDETAIAEAVVMNLSSNLLASDFNIKEARYVGVVLASSEATAREIPRSSLDYTQVMASEECGVPKSTSLGAYVVPDMPDGVVKVYTFISGLGLPMARVEALKKDALTRAAASKDKDDKRNLTLNLDTGVNKTVSQADKVREKIASKSSVFGKFQNNLIDRRK